MPKITLSRESLEKSKNPTILDFLNRYKNRIFTFDTSDRDPSEFGIEAGKRVVSTFGAVTRIYLKKERLKMTQPRWVSLNL